MNCHQNIHHLHFESFFEIQKSHHCSSNVVDFLVLTIIVRRLLGYILLGFNDLCIILMRNVSQISSFYQNQNLTNVA